MGLPGSERTLMICLAILTWYHTVTDRRIGGHLAIVQHCTDTYRQFWHVTSDCRPPVKIWSMIQLQWWTESLGTLESSTQTERDNDYTLESPTQTQTHNDYTLESSAQTQTQNDHRCHPCRRRECLWDGCDLYSVDVERQVQLWGTHERPVVHSQQGDARESRPDVAVGRECEAC